MNGSCRTRGFGLLDALIALAIAVSVAGEVRKPSVYEQRGLLTV